MAGAPLLLFLLVVFDFFHMCRHVCQGENQFRPMGRTFTGGNKDDPVKQVDEEVDGDVGTELLVDQLVDASSPLEQDCVEAAKGAGVAHVTAVRHCHLLTSSPVCVCVCSPN